jgi:hypothetical protein
MSPNHQPMMLLESMEEGILHWKEGLEDTKWLEVGTILGEIIDEDDLGYDEEWKWQAYLHDGR